MRISFSGQPSTSTCRQTHPRHFWDGTFCARNLHFFRVPGSARRDSSRGIDSPWRARKLHLLRPIFTITQRICDRLFQGQRQKRAEWRGFFDLPAPAAAEMASQVNADDLLAVSNSWGPCPSVGAKGARAGRVLAGARRENPRRRLKGEPGSRSLPPCGRVDLELKTLKSTQKRALGQTRSDQNGSKHRSKRSQTTATRVLILLTRIEMYFAVYAVYC